jgi:polysaccharide biosynthesis protein PslH
MNILWIFPDLPYPLTSGLLRGYYLLRELGKRHTITFLLFTHQWPIPPETVPALQPYAKRVEIFSSHAAPQPVWLRAVARVPVVGWRLQEAYLTQCGVRQLRTATHSLVAREHFDVVLFGGRETIPVLRGLNLPLAIDCGDTHFERIRQQIGCASFFQRPRLLYHYSRMKSAERLLTRMTPYRCFISARDRAALLGPSDQSEIVPQGIDYNYWIRTRPASGQNCIVFSGVMNYDPNADGALILLEKILPIVRQSIPNLQTLIVGRDPSPELISMGARYKDVTVTGAVPDVRPYLERADVYVAPLRFASGVQNKVLEALAMEIPVVTTPVVAAGLSFDGAEPPLVIGDNALELANGIIRLLRSADERARLAAAGRQFVETYCSWSASADKLERMCLAAAGLKPETVNSLSAD